MKKKYILRPGYVTSINDGRLRLHWITAEKLMALYGVSKDECYTMDSIRGVDVTGLINLRADPLGNYSLAKP
jgi:hypothetical protein